METAEVGGRVREVCSACGFILYRNPVPGVGVLVEMDALSSSPESGAEQPSIVLIRRGQPPFEGWWALPAGFIEEDESVEQAAVRECKEETGLDVELIEMFHVDSFPTDPTSNSGSIIFYRARPVAGELVPGDDAAEAAIFMPNALPFDVAFRTCRAALARWAGLHGETATFAAPEDEI